MEMVVDCRWFFDGNIKVGNIPTLSQLPGDKEYVTKYGIVKGTCGDCCEHCGRCEEGKKRPPCYVFKSHRFPDVIESQARNTISIRNDVKKSFRQLSDALKRKRKKPVAARFDQSGEIERSEVYDGMNETAKENKEIEFYVYTKKYSIVIPKLLNGETQKNLCTLISIWHEQGIAEYLKVAHLPNVKAFVYCDKNTDPVNGWGVEEYAKHGIYIQTFCKAYGLDGKMNHSIVCEKCKKCFNRSKKCKVIGTWDHR